MTKLTKSLPFLALLLCGCSVGKSQWDSRAMAHTKAAFVGVPTLLGLGFSGTTTPVTPEYSLTNKHVAWPTLREIERQDAFCDAALIRQDNRGERLPLGMADAVRGEKVTLYGYSGRTLLPTSSTGQVLGTRWMNGCRVMFTNAGSVQGMSGGAVVNSSGKLVGIIFAGDVLYGRTYFVPYQSFKRLLTTGKSGV